jgi:hypothetical protein
MRCSFCCFISFMFSILEACYVSDSFCHRLH